MEDLAPSRCFGDVVGTAAGIRGLDSHPLAVLVLLKAVCGLGECTGVRVIEISCHGKFAENIMDRNSSLSKISAEFVVNKTCFRRDQRDIMIISCVLETHDGRRNGPHATV